jgi:phosphate starvation-inducible PhoH-like protein
MEKKIRLSSHEQVQWLFGMHDENLKAIEKEYKVKLMLRGEHLTVRGALNNSQKASDFIAFLMQRQDTAAQQLNKAETLYLMRNFQKADPGADEDAVPDPGSFERFPARAERMAKPQRPAFGKTIGPKTKGQREYVDAIKQHDIVFGIGPAGTGKTYLAMSCAVEALKNQEVRRIILTRPAIEAGESLGYLPGDMYEKISPYLRPLYDALYDMMEAERIEKYLETGIIEVAPLAYMRGRTLNDAFIILDEAQNATPEQMKMFLTRLGFYSKAVITGDLTQSDLPDGKPSGLVQAVETLARIEGIKLINFTGKDVVRHELVQKIIEAYEKTKRN